MRQMRKRQDHWCEPRDLLAGAGLKPPEAARIESPGGERVWLKGLARRYTCLLGGRHPALRRHELIPGCCMERGTCRPDVKGKPQAENPTRGKVPMRGTGADRLVVVSKFL
jgi:hypothetical protein